MPTIPSESRQKYITSKTFIAEVFDEKAYIAGDEDYGTDEETLPEHQHIFADISAWKGKIWKGKEIVSFTFGIKRYYVSRKTFESVAKLEKIP